MPLTSHEIAALAMQQQAMFGNVANYATQISPIQGGVPGMQRQISPYMPPGFVPGIGGGYYSGPAPMPQPRMSMPNWSPSPYGGMGSMAMALPMSRPGSNLAPVMGEQMAMSAMGGLSTIASGVTSIGNAAVGAAGALSLGAGALGAMGGLASGAGLMAGFSAGSAALSAVPLLGGAATALGGPLAGGVILGLEAMKWTTQQVYAGVQERQMVNRTLRQNFGGVRGIGSGQGGMGFSTEEMGGISSMVRSMAGNDINASFEDLTRTLDRTAQMGMYRGVRSAEQFKQRFRETVSSLKEIAQTMHTSMEDATKYMEGSRQMGFFTGQQINENLMRTRVQAGATGMSYDQMEQIGAQGSQMGRAMGMRGRTGAAAMQRMATVVGIGTRIGAFSDELVSEATGGLMGAEAAQALAARDMESSTRWMKRGAGRPMLAALWDPEKGGMNQARLQQALAGGMSFQDLLRQGRRNIADTGGRRSEFFSQEERIRGEFLEAGGGTSLQLAMLEQHAMKRRGVGLDDPIVQRLARKQLDLSQGELEYRIKELREMPRIMEEQRISTRTQMEQEARTRGREGMGVQGLERKVKNWWEREVTGPFKQLGDELTTSMSSTVDRLVQDLEGTVKTSVSDRTKKAYVELARAGGKSSTWMSKQQISQYETSLSVSAGMSRYEGGLVGTAGRMLGLRGPDLETRVNQISGYLSQAQKDQISRSTTEQKSQFYNDWVSTISGGGSGLGYSPEKMELASAAAKKALMQTVGGGKGMVEFRNKMAAARGGEFTPADKSAQSWIYGTMSKSMMQSEDPELRAMFSKAKTPQEKMALLQGLSAGFGADSEFNVEGMWTGATDVSTLGGSLEAYEARDQELTNQLGSLLDMEGGFTKGVGALSRMEQAAGAAGLLVSAAPIPGAATLGTMLTSSMAGRASTRASGKGGTEEIMKSEKLRGLLQTASGTGPAAEDAKTQLSDIMSLKQTSAKELYGLSSVGLETLGRITDNLNNKTWEGLSVLQGLSENQLTKEQRVLRDQEQRLGRELSQSLSSDQDLQRAAGSAGPEAMGAMNAIADAMKRGDLGRARQLESEFYSKYGGTEGGSELAGALSAGGGAGTSFGVGMTRYAKSYDVMKRGGFGATERALGDVGLGVGSFGGEKWEGLGRNDEVRKRKLQKMIEKGMSADDLLKFVDPTTRGTIGAEQRGGIGEQLSILSGGMEGDDAKILAGREASGAAAGARMRGAGGEVASLAEKQANHLKALVEIGNRQLTYMQQQIVATDAVSGAIKDNPPGANTAGGTAGAAGTVPPAAPPPA